MSQIITKPARNAARRAKELKEIRKVKNAIVWHGKQRKIRQEAMRLRFEEKSYTGQKSLWEHENITLARKKALRNAKEDWELGSLRPNRAVGAEAKSYGLVGIGTMNAPSAKPDVWEHRNKLRTKNGLRPQYPLVVADKFYYPIVQDDRVVILKGKDKGKIGVVAGVNDSHQVRVKRLNEAYVDTSTLQGRPEGKAALPMPISLENVRLVIPYEIIQSGQRMVSDVVVDDIVLERHTTGVDPFTGIDHGEEEFPEEHRKDPQTGLPIFNRYIAGTRERIEWPWEREVEKSEGTISASPTAEKKTLLQRLRHPIKSWRESSKTEPSKQAETDASTELQSIERKELEKQNTIRPRSHDPEYPGAYEFDTTRNIVEGSDSMSYTIVAPPFPETLGQELRGEIKDFQKTLREDEHAPRRIARSTPQSIAAMELNRKKQLLAQRMKTPMQVRWELEQAKKKKAKPAVDTDTLLMALGQHMQNNGVKLPKSKADELD